MIDPSHIERASLRWAGIIRLGLVQASLGSVVVLVTSTLNRVMVVEYALPAVLPGLLVALHYAVQLIRPRFGYGSDVGGRRTPWILGGMGVLAIGGVFCAASTLYTTRSPAVAVAMAVVSYAMVGLGVSAAGTSLLALLAKRVDGQRRAAAATIMWILMIAGFAVTSTVVGHFLDPFSPRRLLAVTGIAAMAAFLVAFMALWNVEGRSAADNPVASQRGANAGARSQGGSFMRTLLRVWAEPQARSFTVFVFISMLAYSAQELLLEPFAGLVFGYSLGASAQLSGFWHATALVGMIAVGIACSGARRFGSLRAWTLGGCCVSALALASLAGADLVGPGWPLRVSVMALGVGNGVFAVAAIGSMMELAHQGETGSAGIRMGLWGAAQAVAFALGGVFGTVVVDSIRYLYGSPVAAFATVFCAEALLFLLAARFAARVGARSAPHPSANVPIAA
jgi:BCD family chlorophyll transporter-like MFS transporter